MNLEDINPDAMKTQAYAERLAEVQAEYENKVAELRVQVTVLSMQLEALQGGEESDGAVQTTEAANDAN